MLTALPTISATANVVLPKRLPQFEDKKALLIVTGSQNGKIYCATNSKIEELASIHIPGARFYDTGGFLERPAKNKKMETTLIHLKSQLLRVPFLRELEKQLIPLLRIHAFASIYIFSPDGLAKHIAELIPRQLKNSIRMVVSGNYVRFSPLLLLEKVAIA